MPFLGQSRPSAPPGRQSRALTPLPPHEPLAHPLNQAAQNALHELPRNHKLEPLKARVKAANTHLASAAADVNDRLHTKIEAYEKNKKRREAMSSQGSNDVEGEKLSQMQQETHEMTDILEEKVRHIIDAEVEVEVVERALRELEANASMNRGILAPTQSTLGASQFRGPKRRRLGTEDDNAEEGEESSSAAIESDGALDLLKHKIADYRAVYHDQSLTERYASHNDYVSFKRIVHDARYPGAEAPPLPHASTWFSSATQDTPNESARDMAGTQPVEDEDFQVASERISIKCPITLLPMKDPVSSTKCVHNFEKEAILSMINSSDVRTGGDGSRNAGQKAMKCPVCEEVRLTASWFLSRYVNCKSLLSNQ